MRDLIRVVLFAVVCLGVGVRPAVATPTLQLDIKDGVYDPITETIVATGSAFTLYALLIPDNMTTFVTDTYYISAALVPKTEPPGGSYGSFTFDGVTIQVTEDMIYGRPPIEDVEVASSDEGDIAPHGVYSTYFREFQFTFDTADSALAYNSQDNTGMGPTPVDGFDGPLFYHAFEVDTSNLQVGYAIHFDLYNVKIDPVTGDRDILAFAPFSHDAESAVIPEPSSLLLVLGGAGVVQRLRRRRLGGRSIH